MGHSAFLSSTLSRATTLLLLAIGGCGRGTPDDPEVVLRVSNWGSPATETTFMALERELREAFEAEHGVKVRIELIPGEGQYAPKLMMMHLADNMPDVVHLDASYASIFIDNHVLRDLTPMMQQDPTFDLDDYFPNVVAIARRNDANFAVPLDFTPMVMYYNKRLFDDADLPYPRNGWTWDEFLETAKALTIADDDPTRPPRQFGFKFFNWMPSWVLWIWANDGDVLGPDGKRASGYLDGPNTLEAVRFLQDLMETHHAAPTLQESATAGVDLFRAERAAMDMQGHWMLLDYRAEELDVGIVSIPVGRGKRTTVVYETGLAMSSSCQHPELAWKYIKYMTSRGVQIRRVASGIAISANRKAAAHYADNPIEQQFLDEVEYARVPTGARVERYSLIESLCEEMMRDILSSGVDAETALRETAKLVDAALTE